MAVALEPLKEYKCTYPDCAHSYGIWYEMKQHVKNKTIHPGYCDICKFHGTDSEDLRFHKIQEMSAAFASPDLDGCKRKKVFKHVVCEFCGMDFGSLGGRELHQTREHQADQRIVCNASGQKWSNESNGYVTDTCGQIFTSPSQYMRHIEEGRCSFLESTHVNAEIQRKYVRKEIMKAPDKFGKNLRGKKIPYNRALTVTMHGAADQDGDDDDDDDHEEGTESSGGVQLMDSDELSQAPTFRSLEPNKEIVHNFINQLTIDSPKSKVPGPALSKATPGGVWDEVNSTEKLFPKAKPTPAQPNWTAIVAAHARSRREDEKSNMLTTPIWDPSYQEYNPEIFRTGTLNQYQCPFNECEAEFDIAADITTHFKSQHMQNERKCKSCSRDFKNLTALLQHFEASARGGRCRVARSENYAALVDEATGGFIAADKVYDDKICEDGGRDGVRSHEYTAKVPAHVKW